MAKSTAGGKPVKNNNDNSDYTARQIHVLKGLEAVRKRPGMYIGSTSGRGLHHLVYEVVDNSIDEAMAGHCSGIEVTIGTDQSIRVVDDGRGIPVDLHPTEKVPGVELALTTLHAGGKFDKSSYKVSGGLHGVGVSVVNALSEWLRVEVRRDGHEWTQRYERGRQPGKAQEGPEDEGDTGTTVTFRPDPQVFTGLGEDLEYSFETLANRLRELAYLNRGVRITLIDEREEGPAARLPLRGRHRPVRRVPAGEQARPCIADVIFVSGVAGRHRDRTRDAVHGCLQREHVHLREQHQHARRRDPPLRFQGRPHAHDQQLRRSATTFSRRRIQP